MIPSAEYRALKAMATPERSQPGDMWLCRRLGIVRVFNGHKRGTRHGTFCNAFHLYHWGKRAMWSHPADWRDNDPNGGFSDPAAPRRGDGDDSWIYIGNMFDLLPYSSLAGEVYSRECLA